MDKNFQVGQSNELLQGDALYDLHNCFACVAVLMRAGTVEVSFAPNQHARGLGRFVLTFERVSYAAVSSGLARMLPSSVDEVGYKAADDVDDQWLMSEAQAGPDDHLFLRFDGDEHIRILAGHASLAAVDHETGQVPARTGTLV